MKTAKQETFRFLVAGVKFNPTYKSSGFKSGDEITLVPEPTNKFDKNAILVTHRLGTLGHVPAKDCLAVHPLIKSKAPVVLEVYNGKDAETHRMFQIRVGPDDGLEQDVAVVSALSLIGDGWKIRVAPEAEKLKADLIAQSIKIKKVESDADVALARQVLGNQADFRIALEKCRKAEKQKYLDGGREVDSIAAEFGKSVLEHEQRVNGLISDYGRQQEMKRREAEEAARALQEEAEAKERAAEDARIAAEEAERRRIEEAEYSTKAEARRDAIESERLRLAKEKLLREEEQARKAAMQKSMEAMAPPTKGVKATLDFTVENINRLYDAKPEFVKMEVRTREVKEFLNLQQDRGLPIGLPGLVIHETFKARGA